jgi:hypothetical protein
VLSREETGGLQSLMADHAAKPTEGGVGITLPASFAFVTGDGTLYQVTRDGLTKTAADAGTLFYQDSACQLSYSQAGRQMTVSAYWTQSGSTDRYTVTLPEGVTGTMQCDGELAYGDAGVYVLGRWIAATWAVGEEGRLTQWSTMAAQDVLCTREGAGPSLPYVLTDERAIYQLQPDGAEPKPVLPAGVLDFTKWYSSDATLLLEAERGGLTYQYGFDSWSGFVLAGPLNAPAGADEAALAEQEYERVKALLEAQGIR